LSLSVIYFLPSEFSLPLRTRNDISTTSLDTTRPASGKLCLRFEFLLHRFGQPDARERRSIRRTLPRQSTQDRFHRGGNPHVELSGVALRQRVL
jgi:hypothetical protein